MYQNKTILGLVTARGGSKGVPRKNLKNLAGKPLVGWVIEAGLSSKYLDRLIVSTDDLEIAEVSRKFGAEVPFLRPPHLAADHSTSVDVALHAILGLDKKYDYLVLLQPTSPLTTGRYLDEGVRLCIEKKVGACVSVSEPLTSPFDNYILEVDNYLTPLIKHNYTRRQDYPPVFFINGVVCVTTTESLLNRKTFFPEGDLIGYQVPKEVSADIDTDFDFLWTEFLIQQTKQKGVPRG